MIVTITITECERNSSWSAYDKTVKKSVEPESGGIEEKLSVDAEAKIIIQQRELERKKREKETAHSLSNLSREVGIFFSSE